MRSDFSLIFWIVLLVLLLSGTITLGGIFSFIFYIIGFFILLSLIGTLIFRYRMRKIQQQMNEQGAQQGAQYRTYTWHFGGGHQSAEKTNSSQANRNEGRVRVETSVKPQKRVNDDVGEYVDFEEK